MSLVIVCLLFSSVDYVPVKGEIIWYCFNQELFLLVLTVATMVVHLSVSFLFFLRCNVFLLNMLKQEFYIFTDVSLLVS